MLISLKTTMQKFGQNIPDFRAATSDINPLFRNRWSPHAMSGETIQEDDLMSLFEAAHWAPSSFNEQPWRFVWARRDTEHWQPFLDLLRPGNQAWAQSASHLVIIITKKTFTYDDTSNTYAMFDAGAAWAHIALQATDKDIVSHGIGGFDKEAATDLLNLSDDFMPVVMIALGKHGSTETLSEDLQKREFPSNRKPLKEIVSEGVFPHN